MTKRTINSDYKIGEFNERLVVDYLNSKHKKNKYTRYEKRNSVMDFYNDIYECELKSRSCSHDKYETTIFGLNKIQNMKPDKKYRFYFLFTTGLFLWEYNKDQFTCRYGTRCDRGYFESKKHVYIKIENLKLLTTRITSETNKTFAELSSESEAEEE
jgi:hypothetical protein